MVTRIDILEAVQALQEGGIPPIASAVAWLLAGGKPANEPLLRLARTKLYQACRLGEIERAGVVPKVPGSAGVDPYYYALVTR